MSLINSIIPSIRRPLPQRVDTARVEGPVQKPAYHVSENDETYQLTVQLPGVSKDGLDVTSDNGEIRVVGRRAWKQPEGWTLLHGESDNSTYELVLTHDNLLNNDKITAELRDGVLAVTLPKAEAVKPRKITVG
jgi:HSP20 family molecular chaperone IbpA